jgi:type IV secretory pathway component VirB8
MGFDDFLENKHSYRGNYSKHQYYDDDKYSQDSQHSYNKHSEHFNWQSILDKIRSNRKLRTFIIVAGFLLLILGVVLVIALFPLIVKLFNYISQNGLQGVFNDITGFLEKIWKGSGK